MKEHSLFLKAGFTPVNADYANRAEMFKREFEMLLSQAVALGNGVISRKVLNSGEIVTDFTEMAEIQTEGFTGIRINKEITARELQLRAGSASWQEINARFRQVQRLNSTALRLLEGLIEFKEDILNRVLNCEMFTMNYPLLIEHIIRVREANHYIRLLQ